MSKINRALLLGSVVSAAFLFQLPAQADDTVTTNTQVITNPTTNLGTSSVDAGKLIGKDVIDPNGKTVGEIESVIVDPKGKVTSVVLNVGSWLETDKRISVPWTVLKSTSDGKITTGLTKEAAKSEAAYSYKDQSLRGKILSEAGALFGTSSNSANENSTAANTSMANNTNMSNDSATSGSTFGTPVQNADGTLNASQLIGLTVSNTNNDSIGKISELVMDKNGRTQGVVVDVGGFLGIGTHPVLLHWKQVSIVSRDGSFVASVDMTKDSLKQMPAYKS